ncbi:hypothetical protein ATY81_22430 [Rhizobium sp. R72]|uniref:hypothetical protein n=1 Tax=unclassified Rhizobium TaxID=2613769 RepID=UPI000B52C00E|nr:MULTISPECIES: hypothetical protein [unclassified Rhizobium]OWW02395.1 hypothetical protein ATY81_22430 [Rhizobium sp. R72]OWW02529.1 hypothetical protein ATY80_22430 [Rhizobium sp. R711]
MSENKILSEPVNDLARRLASMIDDEVFAAMELLEKASEERHQGDLDDVLSRIALTESEIERRYPGQLLLPYREWKERTARP